MRIALRTAGNIVCFTSSIIPKKLSSCCSCFCTSYHARASFTWFSRPCIFLTDEALPLNSSLFVCFICRMQCEKCENMACDFHKRNFLKTGSTNLHTGHQCCGNSTLLLMVSEPGVRIANSVFISEMAFSENTWSALFW